MLPSLDYLRALSKDEQRVAVMCLSRDELQDYYRWWECWARPEQILPGNVNTKTPDGTWTTWLTKAGRGWGKTRVGAETVRIWHRTFQYVNLIGATADDARDIMIEGESGLLAICPDDERPIYKPSSRLLQWPNGARSLIFTADEPDRLRGKQHCLIGETLITMGDGSEKRIQDIRPGALVLTRKGPRRVMAVMAHIASVGRVGFSNGTSIVGTGKHPMIVCDGRMICLDKLSTGESVPTVTSALTLVRQTGTESAQESINTVTSGRRVTDPFLRVTSCITKTVTRLITGLKTWSANLSPNTPANMRGVSVIQRTINFLCELFSALNVDARLRENPDCVCSDASPVNLDLQRRKESHHTSVKPAVLSSSPGAGITVASVVSTWEPVGSAEIFDLEVEDDHEFFANGLLSHNSKVWADEVAAWRYQESWDQMKFGLRLGIQPQIVATTTPKNTLLIREIVNDPSTLVTHGTSYENRKNLAPAFFLAIVKKYEGTRLGRQELMAEILDDNPNALWTGEMIEKGRLHAPPVNLVRVVVGVDPAVTANETSDFTGIVVAGVDDQDPEHYYVLNDSSLLDTPQRWGTQAVKCYHDHSADRIVAEVNNGGDLVEALLRSIDPNVSYATVRATRGKVLRAEPIAALYEQGRVHHIGTFSALESQMCDFDPTDATQKSPDRMDALVWALTDLSSGAGGWSALINSDLEERRRAREA